MLPALELKNTVEARQILLITLKFQTIIIITLKTQKQMLREFMVGNTAGELQSQNLKPSSLSQDAVPPLLCPPPVISRLCSLLSSARPRFFKGSCELTLSSPKEGPSLLQMRDIIGKGNRQGRPYVVRHSCRDMMRLAGQAQCGCG